MGHTSCKRAFSLGRHFLVYGLLCAWMHSGTGQSKPPQLTVVYTGGLYGYYRDDARTYGNPDGLIGHFISDHGGGGGSGRPLLLGMGDNFGPEFGASIQARNPVITGKQAKPGCELEDNPSEGFPQALYKDDLRVAKSAECDNVANFLLQAGYRAIVPGREDFMYGSGWLHVMAANLRSATSANNTDKSLTMLAANVRLHLKPVTDPGGKLTRKLKDLCPLFLGSDQPLLSLLADGSGTPATCSEQTSGSPPELLDVLERMTMVENDRGIREALEQEASGKGRNAAEAAQFRNQLIFNQLDELRLMSWGLDRSQGLLQWIEEEQKKFKGAALVLPETDEIKTLRSCVALLSGPEAVGSKSGTSCPAARGKPASSAQQPTGKLSESARANLEANLKEINQFTAGVIEVLESMRGQGKAGLANLEGSKLIAGEDAARAGVRALLRAIAREQWGAGYTVTTAGSGDEGEKLIIGVIGETTLNDVSLTNRSFCFQVNSGTELQMEYCKPHGGPRSGSSAGARVEGDVYVLNPVKTIVALIRAAKLTHPDISVIVMAQMPHTDAEELGAAVNAFMEEEGLTSTTSAEKVPAITLILSEGQPDRASGELNQFIYPPKVQPGQPASTDDGLEAAPVLTPRLAYHISPRGSWLLADPASEVTYTWCGGKAAGGAEDSTGKARCAVDRQRGMAPLYAVENEEFEGTGIKAPGSAVRSSVLLAEKLLGIPEDGSADPVSPYATIELGKRDGTALTVEKLLNDAGCINPSLQPPARAVGNAYRSCDLAVMRLLLEMLQRGARRPDQVNEFYNPGGELTDVAMLENRDIWLGDLTEGYASAHEICEGWREEAGAAWNGSDCELRVALDMVLWKGDYAYRAEAKGSDLTEMMDTSQKLSAGAEDLSSHDVTGEWLATFGLEQRKPGNLVGVLARTTSSWIPETWGCFDNDNAPAKPQAGSGGQAAPAQSGNPVTYCVNGKTIQPDASYWIVTSDHLAQDNPVYATLAQLPVQDEQATDCYLTEKIAQAFHADAHLPPGRCTGGHTAAIQAIALQANPADSTGAAAPQQNPPPGAEGSGDSHPEVSRDVQAAEETHQLRPMFHMEFGKIVAGFDTRVAVNGDSYMASDFQGVTDSRASAPSQRELDLEQQMRGYWRFRSTHPKLEKLESSELRIGMQSDTEFDRSALGNLSGKPENPSFPLNSFTGGIFFEFHVLGSTSNVSSYLQWIPVTRMNPARFALVLAPLQYQRQIVGNYLYFPFTSNSDGGGPKNSFELTVPTEPAYGWTNRLGLRESATTPDKTQHAEWDSGSYWEFGMQLLNQRQVLQALTVDTPDATGAKKSVTCDASGSQTFANCAKAITIDGKSTFSSLTYANPTQYGFYWDVSLQKQLTPSSDQIHKVSLILTSRGDRLVTSHLPLSTETRFDAPLSAAVSFQLLPNLSVSPTYNGFWYSNQVLDGHLFVNEGLITLRWYYDRDSRVPFRPLLWFSGPASNDQTKSMHMNKGGSGQ